EAVEQWFPPSNEAVEQRFPSTNEAVEQWFPHANEAVEQRLPHAIEAVEQRLPHANEAVEQGLPHYFEAVEQGLPHDDAAGEQELPPRVNGAVENELSRLEEGEASSSESDTSVSSRGSRRTKTSRRSQRRLKPRSAADPPSAPTESVCTVEYVDGAPNRTRVIEVASPPRDAKSITSLPGLSWKKFLRDLKAGDIEQVCLITDGDSVSHTINSVGEEEQGSSSSGRNEASVGTRRPREDDSDASSSKRSRSGSDRPLADAGALSTPRGGGDDDSTPSAAVTSRTKPVRDPWMPSPSEIQSRYGSTTPASPYALYSCSAIVDDDVTKELDFDPATDQRRDYYIGLFHELRFYGNKKHSRKSKVTEWEALCQSWGMFVENFNKNPSGYRERVRSAGERYERYSKRPKILRLHDGAVEAGIPCAVPSGVACERCQAGAVRLSERDLNGYTGISVPVELKTLREKLITQLSSESAEGERNTQPRAVGDYSSRSSFTPFGGAAGGGIRTPSPFPERRSSGRSAAPTYRGQ
ncbi:hypothetical protein PR001_g30800, partial [Phytophthora rubi]